MKTYLSKKLDDTCKYKFLFFKEVDKLWFEDVDANFAKFSSLSFITDVFFYCFKSVKGQYKSKIFK